MSINKFKAILEVAIELQGGEDAVQARLSRPEPPESLAMVGDDRYLSVMSRRIFRAGLTHKQVDARWPAFEVAFDDFELDCVTQLDDDDIRKLAGDSALIRHRGKLTAVRDNAIAMQTIVDEHGCFGAWIAMWPTDEIVDLWHELRTRFRQLGGRSAPAFLRMAGKDTFIITDWVVAALTRWAGWQGSTTSRQAHHQIQTLFNQWQEQSDYPLCQISQVLAMSVSEKRPE